MIINRYGPCLGIKLFHLWRWTIEIWFIPKSYQIVAHSHPNENIELMFIWGLATFFRVKNSKLDIFEASPKHMFRTFSIPRGTNHWFQTYSKRRLVFINFSRWTGKPTSAAIDFKPLIT